VISFFFLDGFAIEEVPSRFSPPVWFFCPFRMMGGASRFRSYACPFQILLSPSGSSSLEAHSMLFPPSGESSLFFSQHVWPRPEYLCLVDDFRPPRSLPSPATPGNYAVSEDLDLTPRRQDVAEGLPLSWPPKYWWQTPRTRAFPFLHFFPHASQAMVFSPRSFEKHRTFP